MSFRMDYHIAAFFAGFVLDMIFGDPEFLPHPVRLIGWLVNRMEKWLRGRENGREEKKVREEKREEERTEREKKTEEEKAKREKKAEEEKVDGEKKAEKGKPEREQKPKGEKEYIVESKQNKQNEQSEQRKKSELHQGIFLVLVISIATLAAASFLLFLAWGIHPFVGFLAESIMTYQIFAAKCLKVESMKVYYCLQGQCFQDQCAQDQCFQGQCSIPQQCPDLQAARKAVSMIVGRDTEKLDEEGVAKAAVETVAENTSDGVIAPMLFTALGGPALGLWYKAVNTMDSMVGYKNDKYFYFGRAAAKLDDGVNFFPSRISAFLMILASFIGGKCFSGRRAFLIYKRDRKKHASPNSAQTESVCAGALGIRLAGDASYFGKTVKKPYIGDALRRVEAEDIKRANRLMYLTAWLGEMICVLMMVFAVKMLAA
ncbi:MAG: cobalamin biosynthesis protein [Clostridium sp.]|nr:cobalamin biosynthesis protein [Clostridium sp.]